MSRLTLLNGEGNRKQKALSRSTEVPEGILAKQLLEAQGFAPRRQEPTNGQFEFRCPFHEGPGDLGRKSTNFYLDKYTSTFYCQAAACGEKGNLRLLERYFGVFSDESAKSQFESRQKKLTAYQAALTPVRRRYLREDKGLNDTTIDRFMLGWDEDMEVYVIPYLQGRKPVSFRFYDPTCTKHERGIKYWWEVGASTMLYNDGDAVGDHKGRVFITEGELKAMLLCQLGYNAMAVPGAGTWKPEWSEWLISAKAEHIYVLYDNDSTEFHKYDIEKCNKCRAYGHTECIGHNPGQEGAAKVLGAVGKRAENVLLPLPEGERKVDINEFFMRDGHTNIDFGELVFGVKTSPFMVRSLAQIREDPPEEAAFLVEQGILPVGGRLLVTGAPKAGKSIFVENLALSLASGIPFLRTFNVEKPCRVLLLDRELSQRSLFDRLNILIEDRPGYRVGEPNLLIDHTTLFRLDEPNAESVLINLIETNNADVVIFDTAYKFFSSDFEKANAASKAFGTIDKAIAETGVSAVLTHHHKKKQAMNGKEDSADPDQVAGTFLWTGWPNATVLINFMERRVDSPFNTIASFTAFRDAAPPEPLALYRDRESIAYKAVVPHHHEEVAESYAPVRRAVTFDTLANFILTVAPIEQDDLVHRTMAHFGVNNSTGDSLIKPLLLDIADRHPDFLRSGKGTRPDPYIWKFKFDKEEESFEEALARQGHTQMEI